MLLLLFWFVGLVIFVGMVGNVMYLLFMFLYVMNELGLLENLFGLMMGVVVVFEIFIMLLVVKLVWCFFFVGIMVVVFIFGCCFYVGVYFF